MRVCLFTSSFLPLVGGAERSADLILRGLKARGHEAMVLAQRTGELPGVLPYPVRHYRRPPRQHWWPELIAWPLSRTCRQWKPDVILAFDSYPCGYAAAWLKHRWGATRGVPVITSPRGGDVQLGFHAIKKARVARCLKVGYQRSDRIIAISRWAADRVRELAGEPLPPIDVVYNGIDLPAYCRQRDEARAQPPALEIGGPYVLHLSRVNHHKQQITAIRAVHALRDEFVRRGLKYVVVGDGQGLAELQELIGKLELQAIVRCLGTRVGLEKAWLFDHAEFFVSASFSEGFGHVLIEAMAAGLPILASDNPTHREVVGTHNAGILFRAGDPGDMAVQMRRMLDEAPTLRPAATAGCRHFTLEAMIDGYERACRATIDGRNSGCPPTDIA